MKVALELKNTSRVLKPKKDDVVIYDGHSWYVTTKEDLLKENKELLEECKKELSLMKELQKDVASQLLDMSKLIKQIISK